MIRYHFSSCSRVVIIGTLMKTHSVQEDSAPCPDPWAGSWGVFRQWYSAIQSAVCTRYLMLRRVDECILQIWSGISKRWLWRVEWLLMIWSKQAFASFWRITRLRKVRRCISMINSLMSATKSVLPPGIPPHWFSPICFVLLYVWWLDSARNILASGCNLLRRY